MSAPTSELLLTFANFEPAFANPADIYRIGATTESDGRGVLPEMAEAFDYKLATEPDEANLHGLVEVIGQGSTLQDNIARVQERLGVDAVGLTRSWALRTEFLEPVSRAYIHPADLPETPDYVTMMSDGPANWMDWRAQTLVRLRAHTGFAAPALLAAGNAEMTVAENPDRVKSGMTRAEYLKRYIQPYLKSYRIETILVQVSNNDEDDVMNAAVWSLHTMGWRGAVVMASNAGVWPQDAGRLRRAVIHADVNMHVYVKTDPYIELGTGVEPESTHQNPFSAVGQIAQNHLELFRHIAPQAT